MKDNQDRSKIMEAMNDGAFWHRFGEHQLRTEERPTPKEAADYVVRLQVRIAEMEREISRLELENKAACQQFETFALEVSNLANKRRPVSAV